jgi:hypothetical protein
MEDRIERLFQEWHRLGGEVLLAKADSAVTFRPAEEIIAESTAHCRESGRLTWVVLDWLIRHIEAIDEHKLLRETQECGDLSVLGVLCDAARQRNPHPRFNRLIRACQPHAELAPFFHRVARSPLALRLARENALEIFRRWNYLCSELRYLSAEAGSGNQKAVIIARPPAASTKGGRELSSRRTREAPGAVGKDK